MSLKDDIIPYIDKYGLVAPKTVISTERGSDNGVLFTSEYLIQLGLSNFPIDKIALNDLLKCIDKNGYLRRIPGDLNGEAPDDHYGLLACLLYHRIPPVNLKLPSILYLQPLLI